MIEVLKEGMKRKQQFIERDACKNQEEEKEKRKVKKNRREKKVN